MAAGDLRPLYLASLAGYGTWEREEDAFAYDDEHELEPPVPPGLATLTGPQRALADLLRLDNDLLEVAAETSPPFSKATRDPRELATWVTNLPAVEKNRLLVQVVGDRPAAVRLELLRRFRDEHATSSAVPPRRTVADLLDARRSASCRPSVSRDRLTSWLIFFGLAKISERESRPDHLASPCRTVGQVHGKCDQIVV